MGLCLGYGHVGHAVKQCGSCLADVWSGLAVWRVLLTETFKLLLSEALLCALNSARSERSWNPWGGTFFEFNTHSVLYFVNHIPSTNPPHIKKKSGFFFLNHLLYLWMPLSCLVDPTQIPQIPWKATSIIQVDESCYDGSLNLKLLLILIFLWIYAVTKWNFIRCLL